MKSEDIKALRKALGLTQEDFAHEVGVSFATINRWERGQVKLSKLAITKMQQMKAQHERNNVC